MADEEKNRINEPRVLKDINKTHLVFHQMAIGLRWLQVILGVSAIFSSIAIVAVAKSKYPISSECDAWLTGIAAASLACLSAFGIVQKSNNARNAWRYLQGYRLRFYAGVITLEQYIKAYEEAERIAGSVDFSYQLPTLSSPKPE